MSTEFRYTLMIDTNLCTGCQACVLACSYHITKYFSLTELNSCIKIFRNNADGEVEASLDQKKCDMCPGFELPLCMQFCPVDAIRFVRIKE